MTFAFNPQTLLKRGTNKGEARDIFGYARALRPKPYAQTGLKARAETPHAQENGAEPDGLGPEWLIWKC